MLAGTCQVLPGLLPTPQPFFCTAPTPRPCLMTGGRLQAAAASCAVFTGIGAVRDAAGAVFTRAGKEEGALGVLAGGGWVGACHVSPVFPQPFWCKGAFCGGNGVGMGVSSVVGWDCGTWGGRGNHCPRNEGASPRGECIIPGMGEHRLKGGFVTPEMRNHSLGQGESLWGWGTNAPGTPSASLMLTDGHRRTFPAGLLPRGSAIGIRAAPIWQQLSRHWGWCCRRGRDPAAGQAPETGAELIIAGASYFWGGGCLAWVKGRRGGGQATPPKAGMSLGVLWEGTVLAGDGDASLGGHPLPTFLPWSCMGDRLASPMGVFVSPSIAPTMYPHTPVAPAWLLLACI